MKKLIIFLFILILSIGCVNAIESQWQSHAFDAQNTGQSPYVSYTNGSVAWSYLTGGWDWMDSAPVIDNEGNLYIGSPDYTVTSLYPNGTLRWEFETFDYILDDFVISNDGNIIYMYIDTDNGDYELHAYYLNGTLKWKTNYIYGYTGYSDINIDENDIIYVGDGSSYYYAYYPNGTLKWELNIFDYSSSIVIGNNGELYLGGNYYNLHSLNPVNGNILWSFTTLGKYLYAPSIDSDGIIYATSKTLGASPVYRFYAIYPNGTEKWVINKGKTTDSAINNTDGILYFGNADGTFYAINSNDGSELYTNVNVSRDYFEAPIIDANGIIYVNSYHAVTAFYPNLTIKWDWINPNLSSGFSSLSMASDGTIYATSYDDYLYAFESINPNSEPEPPSTITLEVRASENPTYYSTFINDVNFTGGFVNNNGYITLTPTITEDNSYPIIVENNLYEGIKLTFVSNSTISSIPLTLTGLNPSQDYALYESGVLQYEFRSTSQTYFHDITTHDEISSFQLIKLSAGGAGGRNGRIDDDTEDIIDDIINGTFIIIILEEELPIELTKLILEEPIKTVTTLIKNPINWLIFLGAYVGVLIGMLILPLKVNYADILLYGTLTWILSLLLLIIGLNLSLNYIFTSTSNILGFLTYTIYGLIMSIYLLIKGE